MRYIVCIELCAVVTTQTKGFIIYLQWEFVRLYISVLTLGLLETLVWSSHELLFVFNNIDTHIFAIESHTLKVMNSSHAQWNLFTTEIFRFDLIFSMRTSFTAWAVVFTGLFYSFRSANFLYCTGRLWTRTKLSELRWVQLRQIRYLHLLCWREKFIFFSSIHCALSICRERLSKLVSIAEFSLACTQSTRQSVHLLTTRTRAKTYHGQTMGRCVYLPHVEIHWLKWSQNKLLPISLDTHCLCVRALFSLSLFFLFLFFRFAAKHPRCQRNPLLNPTKPL